MSRFLYIPKVTIISTKDSHKMENNDLWKILSAFIVINLQYYPSFHVHIQCTFENIYYLTLSLVSLLPSQISFLFQNILFILHVFAVAADPMSFIVIAVRPLEGKRVFVGLRKNYQWYITERNVSLSVSIYLQSMEYGGKGVEAHGHTLETLMISKSSDRVKPHKPLLHNNH